MMNLLMIEQIRLATFFSKKMPSHYNWFYPLKFLLINSILLCLNRVETAQGLYKKICLKRVKRGQAVYCASGMFVNNPDIIEKPCTTNCRYTH